MNNNELMIGFELTDSELQSIQGGSGLRAHCDRQHNNDGYNEQESWHSDRNWNQGGGCHHRRRHYSGHCANFESFGYSSSNFGSGCGFDNSGNSCNSGCNN